MEIQVERLSAVIDAVASPRFYPSLLNWLEGFFAFDNAIVYAFERGRPPRCLIKTERENSDAVNQLYQQGAYLQDPFYRALNDGGEGEVLTLRQLAPCGFYHSDYYRNFYRKTGWHDEAGVLLQLTPERGLGVFFGSARRTVAVRYPQRADLRSALTLVKSVARLHGEVVAAPAEAATVNDDGAQARYLLTPREREIVDLILAGCGSQQIADRLFISLGTVKNHRKNIYGKLNIGSQAELFSLLLAAPQRRSA
ncbi:helix-turn-helix transcriptional regulator [Serratia sp. OLHL2]|jgi:DNA-binding CsgD family transcriptional regulator|uniref:helix-turn-helix transcriptional regulator n=1 Tax=Serratia TaxID=613 RepID=UPI00062C7C99|nr:MULTISPECIES: helix-turn-helix transcriptional regulator [Serratia]ALD44220.1 LuxR family transcriptional regulator [Serratia marcescens]ASL95577.1 helix-turn-helix transcriptional regulator [Serratia marcescens]KKZ17567.1 LuxR family transcriptional regulator [Serratia marcescens]MBE4974805.1 helix-turn-helix transcriptional regulator [Serratia sp. X3]MBH1902234.1 helix-turn-helix transcriptional regulator [Serratia ureilytica]